MLINGYFASAAGGSAGAMPLCWWQGWTGRWYVMSVNSLTGFACPARGVYVVARRETDARPTPLMIGVAEDIGQAVFDDRGDELLEAIRHDASEVHVHLLAEDEWEFEAAARDLCRGWNLPIAAVEN